MVARPGWSYQLIAGIIASEIVLYAFFTNE